jgi:hypothetical protein
MYRTLIDDNREFLFGFLDGTLDRIRIEIKKELNNAKTQEELDGIREKINNLITKEL